jgi:maltose alpha-D-glucosyltransferase / alpha-amylase
MLQAERLFQMLPASAASFPEPVRRAAERLIELKPRIVDHLHRLRELPDGGRRIRVHGDLHLGQVLEVDADVYFIDFEGEPARPIAERVLPQSPLKDVAGMMRSFGYAARAAFREFNARHPESRLPLDSWVRAWETLTSNYYLHSYLRQIGDTPLLPTGDARQVLVDAFLLEKGLYELSYELANRPDWIDIPLAALLHLLDPEWDGNEDHRGGVQGPTA